MIDPKLKNWIIIIVTAVWALNFLVGLIPAFHYKSDQAINAIFMATVGGLLAIPALQARGGTKKIGPSADEQDKPPGEEGGRHEKPQ